MLYTHWRTLQAQPVCAAGSLAGHCASTSHDSAILRGAVYRAQPGQVMDSGAWPRPNSVEKRVVFCRGVRSRCSSDCCVLPVRPAAHCASVSRVPTSIQRHDRCSSGPFAPARHCRFVRRRWHHASRNHSIRWHPVWNIRLVVKRGRQADTGQASVP